MAGKAVNGAKKCTACGLTLALYMYRSNGHGYLTSKCCACLNAAQRARFSAKYHGDPAYRENYKAKRRDQYRASEETRKRRIRLAMERKRRARQDGEERAAEQAKWRERYRTDPEFREKIRIKNKAYREAVKVA